jgi:hypothetical protein
MAPVLRPLLAGVLAALVALLVALPPTLAEPPPAKQPDAPPPGLHKGTVVALAVTTDPLHLIERVEVNYALWTLVGEPVEDYKVRWRATEQVTLPWPSANGGRRTLRLDQLKADAPELAAELRKLSPLTVVLQAEIAFFEDQTHVPFAWGSLVVKPDLVEPAGKPQTFSIPQSPEWGEWFTLSAHAISKDRSCWATSDKAACHKRYWKRAKRVELRGASVIYVEWPDTIRGLARRIHEHYAGRARKAEEQRLPDKDFWGKTRSPAKQAPGEDVFSKMRTTGSMPSYRHAVDDAARGARRARYQALADRSAKAFKIWFGSPWGGRMRIMADATIGPQPLSVEVDGAPAPRPKTFPQKDGSVEHWYDIPFREGERLVVVRAAGPPMVEARRRFKCKVEMRKRFQIFLTAEGSGKRRSGGSRPPPEMERVESCAAL